LARVIDTTTDGMELKSLFATYEGGGASSYCIVSLPCEITP
jgi:hypothetical protein